MNFPMVPQNQIFDAIFSSPLCLILPLLIRQLQLKIAAANANAQAQQGQGPGVGDRAVVEAGSGSGGLPRAPPHVFRKLKSIHYSDETAPEIFKARYVDGLGVRLVGR